MCLAMLCFGWGVKEQFARKNPPVQKGKKVKKKKNNKKMYRRMLNDWEKFKEFFVFFSPLFISMQIGNKTLFSRFR